VKRTAARCIGRTATFLLKGALRGHRVLSYHSIGSAVDGDLLNLYNMPVSQFKQQVEMLLEMSAANPYLTPTELSNGLSQGVSLTFDDGYTNTLTLVAPLLSSFRIPFSVFISRSLVSRGDKRYLNEKQIQELASIDGVSLGTHGLEHSPLTTLDSKSLRVSLRESRLWLEDLIQKPVAGMSYPFGALSQQVVAATRDAGFRFAACSLWGFNDIHTPPLALRRLDMWTGDSNHDFRAKLQGGWNWLRLAQPRWMKVR